MLSLMVISSTDIIKRYLENEELQRFPKARIELITTGMATILKNGDIGQSRSILGSMKDLAENRTTHLFIPVNDDDEHYHRTGSGSGGSHWSLLVISLIDNVAFHYDSLHGANHAHASKLLRQIEQALPTPRTLRFVSMQDSPQQIDGSNCGIFVLVIMKHLLLKRLLRADANQKITMST